MAADKKASMLNGLLGRGMACTAEADIPESVLQEVLGVDSQTLDTATDFAKRMATRTGQIGGFSANAANVVASMFTALGQDIACVHEASICTSDFRRRDHPDGGVHISIYMPSLVVGTVGGGTTLPTQRECLEIIDCSGVGKVRRLAEIICGYCLALDISTYCDAVSGQFAETHDRLGRNRTDVK